MLVLETILEYEALRRLVLVAEDFAGFFLFLGVGLEGAGDSAGDPSREGEPPMPAAARKSSTRSSSPPSLMLHLISPIGVG